MSAKKIVIIGTDIRQLYLKDMFALSQADITYFPDIDDDTALGSGINGRIILLPVPDSNKYLLSLKNHLSPKDILFGWNLDTQCCCTVYDYSLCKAVLSANALPTAEGLIGTLLSKSHITIENSHILLAGCGRCGTVIAKKLLALGAIVSIYDTRPLESVEFCSDKPFIVNTSLENHLLRYGQCYDFIVNTVPKIIFTKELLKLVSDHALFLDIASSPGGIDINARHSLNQRYIKCPGLPGLYAQKTSSLILYNYIMSKLKL